MRCVVVVVDDPRYVKSIKTQLESLKVFNKYLKISKRDENFLIPTTLTDIDIIGKLTSDCNILGEYYDVSDVGNESVLEKIRNLLIKYGGSDLTQYIPKKWQIYKPMLLLQSNTFETDEFQNFIKSNVSNTFWEEMLKIFDPHITHIAVNAPILESNNEMRIPYNLTPIYGDFGPKITEQTLTTPTPQDFDNEFWCSTIQNGVLQKWAPKYTMFSRGNIIEKQRILQMENIQDQIVIDLYSGIGYFTLHYLTKGPRHCLCWEINPWSNQGLIRALQDNNITYKLITDGNDRVLRLDPSVKVYIFQESNENCIGRIRDLSNFDGASHINLGLLPTSSLIWPKMLQICQLSHVVNTTLHIHENCHVDQLDDIMYEIEIKLKKMNQFLQIRQIGFFKVKTYAPDIWHIVCDFHVSRLS